MSHTPKSVHQWHMLLEERFQGAPREAARFYGLEILPRLLHRLDSESPNCRVCAGQLKQIDEITESVAQRMRDKEARLDDFQKLLQQSGKHLEQAHQTVPSGLWLSRFTVGGLAAGALLSGLYAWLVQHHDMGGLLLLGTVMGLAAGYAAGKFKEARLRKQKKSF